MWIFIYNFAKNNKVMIKNIGKKNLKNELITYAFLPLYIEIYTEKTPEYPRKLKPLRYANLRRHRLYDKYRFSPRD